MAQTRSETLRDAIEDKIAVGAWAPGYHLDEVELAQAFGVSRTPIREALIQLAAEGIIEIRPRRGAMVSEVPPQRLIEMFEVMAELEALCGRLAARRMTAAEHTALVAAHHACQAARDANDPDAYYYANETFHQLIYAGGRNVFLEEQANALHRRLRPYRRLQLRVRDRLMNSFDEHDEVVQAILAGDGERAASSLRQHVAVQGERFTDLIASLPQGARAA